MQSFKQRIIQDSSVVIGLIVAPPLNSTMMKLDELCAILALIYHLSQSTFCRTRIYSNNVGLANATVNATGDIKMKHTQPEPYPGKWGTIWQIVIACALTFVAFITPVQVAHSNCMDLSDLYRFVNLFGHADSKGGSTKGGDSKCICKHMKIHSLCILACIILLQFVINFWFN